MSGKKLAGMALALVLAGGAQAQPPYVDIEQRLSPAQLRATGLDMLSAGQLALLNRLMREQAAPAAPDDQAGDQAGDRAEASARPSYVGLDDQPIRSRLKGPVHGWEPGTVFTLENGQQWRVLKGHMRLRKPLDAPEVVVVPGIAGRWFLQVDEDLPKARVAPR